MRNEYNALKSPLIFLKTTRWEIQSHNIKPTVRIKTSTSKYSVIKLSDFPICRNLIDCEHITIFCFFPHCVTDKKDKVFTQNYDNVT